MHSKFIGHSTEIIFQSKKSTFNIFPFLIWLSSYFKLKTLTVSLTLIRQGFLCALKTGGGESPYSIIEVLRPQFSPKFTNNGLKWHLAYLSFYKNFKIHTVIKKISKTGRRSNLIWQSKIFSFQDENFWKYTIFDQYVDSRSRTIVLKGI